MSRIIAISNRVAKPKAGGAAAGGLAVGILAALEEAGGMWFGWSGKTIQHEPRDPTVTVINNVSYATVDLRADDYEGYYNGFSNNTLWPLFHYLLGYFSYSRKQYEAYCRVNTLFARKLIPLLQPDDIIWVHDYHLIPLASELRKAGIRQPIGFFLHVPFPDYDLLRALPPYEHMLRSLAAYDVVGFQTSRDLWSFTESLRQPDIGGRALDYGWVEAYGRKFLADVFPIGIDVGQCEQESLEHIDHPTVTRFRESLNGRDLVIGVDRLDYSKGLELRFRAYERLLEKYPATNGKTILMQIAPPTRTGVRAYESIRQALEQAAGNINGRFADIDWVPIRYLNRGYDRAVLMALYRGARVGMVTPIRDGMNLVAKEFVAAQDRNDPGMLVLSSLAGAAKELDAAVLVNPYDREGVADGVQSALEMSLEERVERVDAMRDILRRNDIHAWTARFIGALKESRRSGSKG